ncbi:hypothetical protein [uncultured Hymenobacter sp.]|uniref:hypothetical protein n=1 Tax=uncultured Hymenobacter sp. TaxID=170016 RepID=UPI0035C9A69F
MLIIRLFALTALPLLLAATCQPADRVPGLPPALKLKPLYGTWLHSQEEDRGDTLVYRPNTYNFPPSRGRTGFAIGPGGRFTQYDIAPTDGLQGQAGTWTQRAGNRLRIQLSSENATAYELEIVRLEGKKLYLRRLEMAK